MIDNFAIALTHGLLLLAFWRLSRRPDLDREEPVQHDPPPTGFGLQNQDRDHA